ncbi:hypothetical protein VNO78_26870 [Psophocarpus tetragonolobus]|uniref:Large ribosomal subunit protein bL12 C-terminal domain-containing protein n=1 Tax=Psophocarpus tetragonolobus TaxID=3891 RepID=A0AAN9X9G7_PSOTE
MRFCLAVGKTVKRISVVFVCRVYAEEEPERDITVPGTLRQPLLTMRYYSRFKHLCHVIKTRTRNRNPSFGSAGIPIETKRVSHARDYCSASQSAQGSEKVSAIVDEVMGLTLLEVMDLVEVMREKRGVNELPIMMLMVPGMGLRGLPSGAATGGGGAAGGGEAKPAEKTAFDVKLEGFDAAAKIKVIKEVRTFTSLGLKEAKDLVEKVPAVLKKGVTKEEAESIMAKMKEVGAKVSLE